MKKFKVEIVILSTIMTLKAMSGVKVHFVIFYFRDKK